MFASGRYKRPVRVSCFRFPGHPHWYVTLHEEEEYVWDGVIDAYNEKGKWWSEYGAMEGKQFRGRFEQHEDALDFILKHRDKHFHAKTHVLVKQYGGRWTARCRDAY